MNEHQIACFIAVKNHLNFSLAAKQLFITQPALSYQIKSLETELAVKLFERSTTSVCLTDAGLAFAIPAQKLYDQFRAAANAVQTHLGAKSRIVLAFPHAMIAHDNRYKTLINHLVKAFPQCEFEVRNYHGELLTHFNTSDAVGCVISLMPPQKDSNICYEKLFQSHCYFIASPNHSFFGQQCLPPAAMDGQILYYEKEDEGYIRFVQEIISRSGAYVSLKCVDSYDMAYSDLVAGKGLFVSPLAFSTYPKEWYIPLLTDAIPPTVMMYQKDEPHPCIPRILHIIKQTHEESE